MSDISFTRSLGDKSVARAQTGQGASPTGVINNASVNISSAKAGTLITGVVAELPSKGNALIKTDKGALTLQTNLALKTGNTLVMQLLSTGTQTRVQILSIDGEPLGSAQRQSAVSTAAPADSASAARLAGAPTAGGGVDRSLPQPAGQAPAPAGSGAQHGHDTSGLRPQGGPQRGAAIPGADVRGPLTPGLVLPAQVIGAGGGEAGRVFQIGATLTVRILTVAPAGTLTVVPSSPPLTESRSWLQGQIAPSTTDGTTDRAAAGANTQSSPRAPTVLNLAQGRISLPAPPPGPPGTIVMLEVLDFPKDMPATRLSQVEAQTIFTRHAGSWPALEMAISRLESAPGPAVANNPVPPVPQPGHALAGSVLFFLAALKGGDVRSWLGEQAASRMEASLGTQAYSGLGDDFAQLGRLAADTQASGWQVMLVPLLVREHVEQLRMYYRHQTGQDEDDAGKRFVIEAYMKKFGLVQLDGLVRRQQFDLVMRSDRPLPGAVQNEIREIFAGALEIGGLNGGMRFEDGVVTALDPFAGTSQGMPHGGSVVV